MIFMSFFFNVTFAVHIPNAPKTNRLNTQQRQDIINSQQREVPNPSPKQLRRLKQLATKINRKSRSVSPARKGND